MPTTFCLLPSFSFSPKEHHGFLQHLWKPHPRPCPRSKSEIILTISRSLVRCSTQKYNPDSKMDPVDTGSDVECFAYDTEQQLLPPPQAQKSPSTFLISTVAEESNKGLIDKVIELAILVSPFFFWGTSMVGMKEVIPKMGPFFVSAFRLIPAGAILIGFATAKGRQQPVGLLAWISILLFGVVDGACFQGFLVEGLQRTSAGLGSVIIDSQPLTVSVLAALLFGESISTVGFVGLLIGIAGLLLLEDRRSGRTLSLEEQHREDSTEYLGVQLPAISLEGKDLTIWGSGEWWMLLAAQSMAIGTVMVRWVSKYSDPVMATGWHMIIGGLPLLVISVFNHDPAITGSTSELTFGNMLILLYTSIFGSAVSYGVFFYNATRGSLTKLSSLTFLTPVFASISGFVYLGETFTPLQFGGALMALVGICFVNYESNNDGHV